MEFLLVNHPLDCPVCDKGGECPLQNQAMTNGRGETRFEGVKRTFPKPINISAQVLLDRERCVLCARCTRFSEQIAGDPFIALLERGALQQVGIYEKEPFESYFSGNTIQICPVGALTSADYRFRSRPFDLVSSPSVGRARRVRRRDPRRPPPRQGDAPAGRQRPRGQRGVDHRQGPLRVPLRPVRRPAHPPAGRDEDGELRPASWPEAFAVAARGLQAGRRRRRAARRPGDRRGRLRLRQVRPGRARHQRRRLPGPAALGRGGRLPGRRGRARGSAVTYTDLEQAPTVVLAGPRPRGRGRHDLPAAAQGLARPAAHARRRARALHLPRPAQDGRHRGADPARRRARGAVRPARARRPRRRQARRDPGRRAAGHRPGRADRGRRPRAQERCPAGLGAAPRR